ncbi:hypothetical protein XaraCFBP7407_18995 [Xanthomonas arboricola pv. arracaciae]|uniref:hypothetical protein n=1 Tax=Xanthomonas arboricola TaxID=56448 RepID=UPI000CEEBF0B|nr:hypothetical protein [Xanthomonas arboricola]PPT93018.1 hypothetical protein XaraCFBP7407_18995 [Xanthomonas arboricola pv. arracaciae]
MQRLISDLEALLAAWEAQAKTFDSCDMPASALAFRECQRRLGLVLAAHAVSFGAHSTNVIAPP